MTQRARKVIGITGITLAVYLGMKYLLPVAAPFLAAFFLVKAIYPLAWKLSEKMRIKKEAAALLILLAGTIILAAVLWLLCGSLCRQIRIMVKNFDYYEAQIHHLAGSCSQMAENTFGFKKEEVMTFLQQSMEHLEEQIRLSVLPEIMQNFMKYIFGFLKTFGIFFLILIAVLLFMKDYKAIEKWLQGKGPYKRLVRIGERLWSLGGAYLRAQFLIMLLIMGICSVGLMLMGNSYAIILGVLIGFVDVFPFIGTGTILIPWAFFVFLKKDFIHAAGYVILFIIANTTREYLEPKLIGNKMGVYPIAMAMVVYAGVWIYGLTGVLLGPVSLMIILEYIREFYPNDTIMKGEDK